MSLFCTAYQRIDGSRWAGPYLRLESEQEAQRIAQAMIPNDEFFDHVAGVSVDGELVDELLADPPPTPEDR